MLRYFIALFLPLYLAAVDLTIIGKIKRADGLGRQTLEMLGLYKDYFNVECIATRSPDFDDVSPELKKLILPSGNTPQGKVVLYEEFLWYPGGEKLHKVIAKPKRDDQIRIAHSMFDATEIPPEFTQIINLFFDAVAVPDKFLVDVYKRGGVTVPIFVLPLSFNFSPLLEEPLKESRHSPFVFSCLGSCVVRKNQLTLVRAFAKAFPDEPDVKLVLNARYHEKKYLNQMLLELRKLKMDNIIFKVRPLSQEGYRQALLDTDCLVNVSKGEGYSIQPREAMALGIPVIVSDNTAQTTLCESGLVVAVPSLMKEPAFSTILNRIMGEDFNCEVDDVAAALKEVYENYNNYLALSPQMRAFAEQYDFSKMKPLYLNLVHPKKVLLGKVDEITEEGLTTTSPELYEKYRRLYD